MIIVTGIVLGLSGRWTDPWLWTYIGVWAVLSLYVLLWIDDNLAKERFSPPSPGADRIPLRAIRLAAAAHVVVGALDVGRLHLADGVPAALRVVALAGMALGVYVIFRAMRDNYFFSPVVRIQRERGHHLVDTGLYAFVRHPGYAGMIVAIPLSGLALGSWLGAGAGLLYSALIFRRVLFEDAFLKEQLEGYADYARRVPARLIPAIW
jgi:protein-S-isoprenylcysteine O-methyltransferase Ste14